MTEEYPGAPQPAAQGGPAASGAADWEAFYRDYRKPGYIDGFEITTKLGGGMFGLVFRARRMSIGKDYAIKFLQVDDGEVRRAVLSELEQVKYFAQIDHPNLVSIEDRGEVDGIPYLVMAFAGTETLRDKMPEDRPPTKDEKGELVRAFLQAARGLQALHERSLVHFDIKPANVFLKGGVARLGDYGLSKLVTHSRGSLSMGRGTPYYMAPEMLQRRGDQRSDIYSLGVMLYELLCGKVPFTGDSEWEVLKKHETAQPELPDYLTQLERAVLLRCLAKDPAARFESVADLLEAYGAPQSPGAATLSDVRGGVADDTAPRSATPPPPPPPSGVKEVRSDENPYKEMADASRKAFKHANEVARQAMRDASVVAKKAAQQAREAFDKSMGKTREYSVRRWRAMQRLRKQKKDDRAREKAVQVAAAVVTPPKDLSRRGPSMWRRVAWTFAALFVLVVTLAAVWFSMLMPRSMAPRSSSGRSEMSVAATNSGDVTTITHYGSDATYSKFSVPGRYRRIVSTSEPMWARLADRDRHEARRQLLEHIQRLRSKAPIEPGERKKMELPTFGVDEKTRGLQAVRDQVALLLAKRGYDAGLAGQIVAKGPLGLAVCAEAMAGLEYRDGRDFESAKRLQKVLVGATTCRDLELVSTSSASKARAYNQPLGHLWGWFVNEFAHSERTWQAYRQLFQIR